MMKQKILIRILLMAFVASATSSQGMEPIVQPLNDLHNFSQVTAQLDRRDFYATVKNTSLRDADNKGVIRLMTGRIRRFLSPGLAPCQDFVTKHIAFTENEERSIYMDMNGDGIKELHKYVDNRAYVPLKLKSREIIVCMTNDNTNFTVFNPTSRQPFNETRAKRLYIQATKELFPWSPQEGQLKATAKGLAYDIDFKEGVRIDTVWGTASARVSPNYVLIHVEEYGRHDSRPAFHAQSHEFFDFLNNGLKENGLRSFIQPAEELKNFDVMQKEIPSLAIYVTLPQKKQVVNPQRYSGVLEAFSWRLKKIFKPQFAPCSHELATSILLQRGHLLSKGKKADIAFFPVRLEGADKRDFIIAQTAGRIVITSVVPWGTEVNDAQSAAQILSDFMKNWLLQSPTPQEFLVSKTGAKFNLAFKSKKPPNSELSGFRATITQHGIVIIVNAPQLNANAKSVAADKWFVTEK